MWKHYLTIFTLLLLASLNNALGFSHGVQWMNFHTGALPHFKTAVAATLAGSSDTVVAVLGDSTTIGEGATVWTASFPSVMATKLTSAGYPSATQGSFGSTLANNLDPRLSLGSGWQGSGALNESIGGEMFENNTTTTAATFTPTVSFDGFDFYYFDSGAVFSITVDGTTVDTITQPGTLNTLKKHYSVSAGTHVLGVTRVSGNCFFMGWDIQNSASKTIRILNFGATGTDSSTWASTAASWEPGLAFQIAQPSLSIINLGINDWALGTPPAAFNSNIQALISAALAINSDVLLEVPVPTASYVYPIPAQNAIIAQIYALAISNNLIGLDMTNRWGGEAPVAATFYCNGDGLHPCDAGYADEALALSNLLNTQLQ